MVTKEKCTLFFYRLHFVDVIERKDMYQNVISKNIDTMRYYVKKMERTSNWFLTDFYELWIFHNFLYITKYVIQLKEVHFQTKRYFRPIVSIFKSFDELLRISGTR
jgi:hypothetical protein